jgi:hypothetical protein
MLQPGRSQECDPPPIHHSPYPPLSPPLPSLYLSTFIAAPFSWSACTFLFSPFTCAMLRLHLCTVDTPTHC